MSLHLIELPLRLDALHRWSGVREIGRGCFDEGLALHHLLGEVFGPAMLKPFRLMVAPRAVCGTLYAYSNHPAEALVDMAQSVTGPTEADVLPLKQLRSIPRPAETWKLDQRLGFDLRVRPVVRLASAMETDGLQYSRGAELDAFLVETLRNDQARTREEVYVDWLVARLAPTVELDRTSSRMHSFRRLRLRRDGHSIEGPDAVFHGTLTIRDPARFADMLAQGIGRHRAYGYGMLLLRPPQRGN